jgi:imidazole glycerol-phosphate synthase subunit HisH
MINSKFFPSAISEYVKSGKNFMGICLGMQMLLSKGFEHRETDGLNIIQGDVIPLPTDSEFKVPNINWHEIMKPNEQQWNKTILQNTKELTNFYFVHSFYANPSNKTDVLAETNFGNLRFASAIKKDNVFGTQFHPEKSGAQGLKILETLLKL